MDQTITIKIIELDKIRIERIAKRKEYYPPNVSDKVFDNISPVSGNLLGQKIFL